MSHWAWEHFFTDGTLYRNNNSNKNAWCKRCLTHQVELLQNADIVAVATTGMGEARTAEEQEEQGTYMASIWLSESLTPRLPLVTCSPTYLPSDGREAKAKHGTAPQQVHMG